MGGPHEKGVRESLLPPLLEVRAVSVGWVALVQRAQRDTACRILPASFRRAGRGRRHGGAGQQEEEQRHQFCRRVEVCTHQKFAHLVRSGCQRDSSQRQQPAGAKTVTQHTSQHRPPEDGPQLAGREEAAARAAN